MTASDIVGFPEFTEAEELDRSLLEVKGSMRVSFGLRVATECEHCRAYFPINGYTDQVSCPGCGRVNELTLKGWQFYAGEEAIAEAFVLPVGGGVEERYIDAGSSVKSVSRRRRQAPHCHGCQQPLPDDIVEEVVDRIADGEATALSCPACGAQVPVRPADDWVRSLCPQALAVVSETLEQEAARGLDGAREFYVIAQIDEYTRWYWLLDRDAIEQFPENLDGVKLPVEVLERLANDSSPSLRAIAGAMEETTWEVLERLATDEDSSVREAVASNPRVPENLLPRLASDDNYRVRLAVARNPDTPTATILKLAEDSDSDVREAASRRKDQAWEETESCPVCGSGEIGQQAPCSTCGARQVIVSVEEGRSGAEVGSGPLVQLGGEVAAPDDQGFELSLPGGRTVRVRTRSGPRLKEGDRVELLGEVALEFDERAGGERLAAHQIPVLHARVVTSGADAAEQMARAIAELEGGRLIPMPPGLRITYIDQEPAWRLRLTARIRPASRFIKRAWPVLLPAPLMAIFLGLTGGLNLATIGVIGFFALFFTYSFAAIDLNKPCITVDARTLRATPWPFPWKGARSVATDRVAQLLCSCERNGEYSLWAELKGGEKLDLTEGRYDLEELFFIKRAVETVLGIQDRPAHNEARPFEPHDRLALPATLKPRPRPANTGSGDQKET